MLLIRFAVILSLGVAPAFGSATLDQPVAELDAAAQKDRGAAYLDVCAGMDEALAGVADAKLAEESCENALALLELAAARGQSDALRLLGWMYSEGVGVRKQEAIGAGFYELAAAAGDTHAMLSFALVIDAGLLVPRDLDRAIALAEGPAREGNPAAQTLLGRLLAESGRGDLAAAWFELACLNGFAAQAKQGLARIESAPFKRARQLQAMAQAITAEHPHALVRPRLKEIGSCLLVTGGLQVSADSIRFSGIHPEAWSRRVTAGLDPFSPGNQQFKLVLQDGKESLSIPMIPADQVHVSPHGKFIIVAGSVVPTDGLVAIARDGRVLATEFGICPERQTCVVAHGESDWLLGKTLDVEFKPNASGGEDCLATIRHAEESETIREMDLCRE